MLTALQHHISLWLSGGDPLQRALRVSGVIRFAIMLLQGVLLVRLGVSIQVIALVEAMYYIFNVCRVHVISGGRYAGYKIIAGGGYGAVFTGFVYLGGVAALLTIVAMWLMRDDFSLWHDASHYAWIVLWVGLSVPAESYDILYADKGRPRHIIYYTTIVTFVQMGLIVGLLLLGTDIWVVLKYWVMIQAVRVFHLIVEGRIWGVKNGSRDFILMAFPLIVHAFVGGMVGYVDGWMIQAWEGDSAFVYYRYGAREQPLLAILVGAAVSAMLVRTDLETSKIKHEIRRLLHLLGPLTILLSFSAPWIFQLVYGEDFVLSGLYFSVYGLLVLSRVVFVQVFYYFKDRRWRLAAITLAEVVSNVGLSILLYQLMGLWGIPLATVIVDVLFRVIMIYDASRFGAYSIGEVIPMRTHLVYLLGITMSVISSFYLHLSILM